MRGSATPLFQSLGTTTHFQNELKDTRCNTLKELRLRFFSRIKFEISLNKLRQNMRTNVRQTVLRAKFYGNI